MGTRGRHAVRESTPFRLAIALVRAGAVAAAAGVVLAYLAVTGSTGNRAARVNWSGATQTLPTSKVARLATVTSGRAGLPAGPATTLLASGPLAVSAHDHRMCPTAATACVDLARHLTWLQSGGKVTFGPVWMEPGPAGTPHATPRGTFGVMWKGGPNVMSNLYDEPMPWAVIFTSGGVAFHAGSLSIPSHGCVHLTMASARYYNEHLTIGTEVVVF
ncbi:MAG TPA: L,D-transpeptidase [Trebonia sp.]|nr:L,D-transpeptidase [Trebonia sp.]